MLDAAALASAQKAVELVKVGDTRWKETAEALGHAVFSANFKQNAEIMSLDPKVSVSQSATTLTANTSVDFAYRTTFLSLLGMEKLSLVGAAKASSTAPNYIDVHILVDLSSSMGIGATLSDQTKLINATSCAIACHVSFPWDYSNYNAARASGAKLRIDVVRDAVVAMLNEIMAGKYDADQVRVSIDGFSNELIPILAPTTSLTTAHASTSKIDLTKGYSVGTNISYALQQVVNKYPASGSGTTRDTRKSFVVLITDGVENSMYPTGSRTATVFTGAVFDPNFTSTTKGFDYNSFQRMQAMALMSCTNVKNKGHTVLVGQVEYLEPYASHPSLQWAFDTIETLVKPAATTQFKSCASDPAKLFNARDSSQIKPMFDQIIAEIIDPMQVRLTN